MAPRGAAYPALNCRLRTNGIQLGYTVWSDRIKTVRCETIRTPERHHHWFFTLQSRSLHITRIQRFYLVFGTDKTFGVLLIGAVICLPLRVGAAVFRPESPLGWWTV